MYSQICLKAFAIITPYVDEAPHYRWETIPTKIIGKINKCFVTTNTDYRIYSEEFADLLNETFPKRSFVIFTRRDDDNKLWLNKIIVGIKR